MATKNLIMKNAVLGRYTILNSSVCVNPRFSCIWSNGEKIVAGKTQSDAQCGYTLTNFNNGRKAMLTYHYTSAGNVIITKIEEEK